MDWIALKWIKLQEFKLEEKMQWRGKERQRCAPRNEATKESQKMMSGSVRDGVSLSLSASHRRALGFPGSAGVKEPTCRRQWETRVWSRGQEDPLEEGMATHSSILAWRIPQTEKPGGLQSMGLQRVRHNSSDLARSTQRTLDFGELF